jgi:hypothetical protein
VVFKEKYQPKLPALGKEYQFSLWLLEEKYQFKLACA